MNLTCSNCNKVYKKPKSFDKHMQICNNDTDSRSFIPLKNNEQCIHTDDKSIKIHTYTQWLNNITLDAKSTFEYLVNNSIETTLIQTIKLNTQQNSPFYALENKIIILDNKFRYFKNEDYIKLIAIIHQKITQIVCTWNEKNLNNIKLYEQYQRDYFNVLDKITISFQNNRKRIYSSIKQLINNIVS